jgi:hypothetical protein
MISLSCADDLYGPPCHQLESRGSAPGGPQTGGPAPVRAYIEGLLPGILDGTVGPGEAFDRTVSLDETPDGYRAMDRREALKVLIQP